MALVPARRAGSDTFDYSPQLGATAHRIVPHPTTPEVADLGVFDAVRWGLAIIG